MLRFHGGITTAKFTRLGGGLKDGNVINGEIPIINRYELGYYFRLSVNLSNLKK